MSTQIPNAFLNLREAYPDVAQAYESLATAIHSAGSLSDRERQLVKLALSIGAGLEGATHAHTRRSVEQGLTAEEIRQVALLGVTTLGLPSAVRGYTWINDVLESES
jgi:alkylhydroperoxidase/carboxymuconolactone decarboxylase family protein YurZ